MKGITLCAECAYYNKKEHRCRRLIPVAKPWENKSGYPDPTAYEACKPTPEEIRVGKLVKALKSVSSLFGFEIINRIEFRDVETGRTYR